MASLGGNLLAQDVDNKLVFGGIALVLFSAIGLSKLSGFGRKTDDGNPSLVKSIFLFCYSCFLTCECI